MRNVVSAPTVAVRVVENVPLSAVDPPADSYPGFHTSAWIVTSRVCWIVGAVNVVMKRPSDPVTPVAGLTGAPVSTTFAFSTGRLALSITVMITLVERPEATEFVKGTMETLRDPFGIT